SSLRRPVTDGSQKSKGSRRVHFSDGLNPGDELVEEPMTSVSRSSRSKSEGASIVAEGLAATMSGGSRRQPLSRSSKKSLIPKDGVSLPPVIIATETKGEYVVEENPKVEKLMPELRNDTPNPVVFVLNKNLFVLVKIIDLNCCVNRTCWCFSTKGMPTVGQDELVVVLECTPDEKVIPRDIFVHFNSIYHEAAKGNTINDMSHSLCGDNFLGSRQHGGFLFLKSTFQCLRKLILPEPPYLFGVLLQKWETPWAKVFPLRLMLRLGAEFRYYPCPLMSVRGRKPVYGEIGHTIMNLLADFKNYQYMLPQIPGITIHMQKKETRINFPNSKYDEIMKVISNSNEHVMAVAANFSTEADSHLVCIQNDMANYQTQAINIQNKPRQVTGASFVVFNGALKASTGLIAKSSIVEDGVMVQIQPDMMAAFRQSLREMKDFRIPCGPVGDSEPEEVVIVKWIEETRKVNQGVKSPIDGRSMEGIDNIRIHHGTDFMGKTRAIRWTEVFFLESNEAIVQHLEPVDLSRLAETLATSCCVALVQHLDSLKESGMAKIALRVTVDAERVGYEAGSNGQALPASYMNSLDNEMIPVLHNAVSQFEDGPVIMELIFHIID
ncbi:zinc finger FYVE domain-containing protein 9-like, partial [Anneissia japonica]|uniref:zinc finger FYVE domain-containing protein 9-like n=1 Tax=Anneissia japonica TaxID=1529436 RepID=UPI00142589BF